MKNKKYGEITASIMCSDLFNLGIVLNELETCHTDYFHIDIMDGHFVSNITLGIDLCAEIGNRYITKRDIHMLVEHAENFIGRIDLKPNEIFSVHLEACEDIDNIARLVHCKKGLFGIALNPKTEISEAINYLNCTDVIVLMMIKPGFAGRKMENGMIEKIAKVRKFLDDNGYYRIKIEVDGNVSVANAKLMREAGGDIFVAGTSAVFNPQNSIDDGMSELRNAIR
ncbi:MAG: ribulose-phosphate 3-epimerase [Clostridia bacterium]